jgi:hypothetical protein
MIADATGMHLSALKRYLSIPANRVLFRPEGSPPTYPAEMLPFFQRLHEMDKNDAVTPKTLAGMESLLFMQAHNPESGLQIRPSHAPTILSPNSSPEIIALLFQIRDALAQPQPPVMPPELQMILTTAFAAALRQHHAETAAEAPDAVLSVQKAAELLSCRPEQVCRHIKPIPGRRGKYSAAAVQAKIREWCNV